MSEALAIIDVQKDYFPCGRKKLKNPEECLTHILKWEQDFILAKKSIVYIQHIGSKNAPFFCEGNELHEKLNHQNVVVIAKSEPDSFMKITLNQYLVENKIDKLIICGMMTHMCVDITTRSVYEKEYQVKVIADGCATLDITFKNRTVLT